MNTVGPYQLTRFLSSGTLSGVWECRHITTGDMLACKVVDNKNVRQPDFLRHFKNELIIHSQIRHPAIAKLIDVLVDADKVYVFLELCEGGDLNDVVMSAGCLPEPVARRYFGFLMSALSYVHALGVAHRDVKLENILVTEECAKLTDFGLCKPQQEGNLLLTTCGTLVYAAPEIIREVPYDGMRADIWSAGIVLYAMVAGHFPWASDEDLEPEQMVQQTARQIVNGEISLPDDMSFELQILLSNMLNVDPECRPTADDILQHPWMEGATVDCESGIAEPDMNLVNLVKSLIVKFESEAESP